MAKGKPRGGAGRRVEVVVHEVEPGTFRLYVQTLAGFNPAGPRLLKGEPWPPKLDFGPFFDRGDAEQEAARLREYLDKTA